MKASLAGIDVLIGTNGRSDVYCTLDSQIPHLFIESITGYGKTTMIRSIISDLVAHYSPEELEIYVSDMKEVEGKQIMANTSYSNHIVPLSHTLQAESFIEWLDQIAEKLNQRNSKLIKAGCRNIYEYKQHSSMPRMILFFDEIGAALRGNYPAREQELIHKKIEWILRMSRAQGAHVVATSSSASNLTQEIAKLFGRYVQLAAAGFAAFEGKLLTVRLRAG